ncbi:hypothetical protein, variant [Spizellomyces punctatus DAOM BR117]|uniref:Calponin-homology (CH) domain-containing protein n=1 Tax=Spizellomyces punctatus (strain DAOM BR117) TaxID=645134 RepID=A0A0L0HPM5_SPIPD|nr:hypothetical protein, variant [Spizellomyces punctatus DAOM BR117]KND03042.1 hypothetical protein, variant [Spizellomyces punctatus DAOM BR117]|eukprot:XP_016611081.1 hypothetical protein, variant [Spizellomyces punctatus DAOM BR117]
MKKSASNPKLTGATDALARADAPYRPDVTTTYQMHPTSKGDPNVKRVIQSLTAWVNSYVINDSMTVRDLVADMDDGQILAAFLGQITGEQVVDPQMLAAKSERSKVAILAHVIKFVEVNLKVRQDRERWTIEGIMSKDISSIICLLVDLAQVLGCPYSLPPGISMAIIKREELPGGVKNKTTVHKITPEEIKGVSRSSSARMSQIELLPPDVDGGPQYEPDALDKLFETPEKMDKVTKLLLEFVNSQLEGLDIRINSLTKLEGIYLIFLIGTLGNFFVPLHHYTLSPTTLAEKIA